MHFFASLIKFLSFSKKLTSKRNAFFVFFFPLHHDEKNSKNEAKKLKITPHYQGSSESENSKFFAKVFLGFDKSTSRDYFIESEECILAISGGEKFGGNGNLSVQPYQNHFRGDLQHFEFERKSLFFGIFRKKKL